jgi:CheY-like chemotaxis protein
VQSQRTRKIKRKWLARASRVRLVLQGAPNIFSCDLFRKGPPLTTSRIRVFVVDDFEPFRAFVCSTLRQKPELEVVCELSDGLAAAQKAEELKPDLIVLDIGLPTLNGLEAARQIRSVVPSAKIVFLTQESSGDVVQEAFRSGAQGYVAKTQAGRDLLAAVEAVLEGRQFVSGGLTGHHSMDVVDRSLPDVQPVKAPPDAQKPAIIGYHDVLFYPDDACLLENFSRFVEAALEAGNAVIVVVTESHRVGLREILEAHGVDIAAAVQEGRYIPLNVEEMLSAFVVGDMPDPIRFAKVASDLVNTAAKTVNGKRRRVSACEECAPVLWAKGMAEGAIRLEQLWNGVVKTYGVDILCGYPVHGFYSEENKHIFQRICAEHSTVYHK